MSAVILSATLVRLTKREGSAEQFAEFAILNPYATAHSLDRSKKNMKKTLILALAIAATAALSARADDAKAIYEKDCAKCHGADGRGDTKMGKKLGVKDYTEANVQADLKD